MTAFRLLVLITSLYLFSFHAVAAQTPALTLDKSTPKRSYTAVGDTIAYSYAVTNSGDVILAEPVTITDDKTTATCTLSGDGDLDVGEIVTCTAVDYVITQADIDNGSVTNVATASADGTTSNQDSVTVEMHQIQQCAIHWDCPQGQFCSKGLCLIDAKQDVYHCGKQGCPPGHWCMDQQNGKDSCEESTIYECEDACDCGPAHACLFIAGFGKRCVKDVDDPWKPGGDDIFGVGVPEGEATYCCPGPGNDCWAGQFAYDQHNQGEAFACYFPEIGSASNYCGGNRCRSMHDCAPEQSCLDSTIQGGIGKPSVSCNSDATRCVSHATAVTVFGVPASALSQPCNDGAPGQTCEQGWTPGGSYLSQRVVGTIDSCGNGTCDPGEYPDTCADCSCGDGSCAPSEIGACSTDCGQCGDGNRDPWETPKTCPEDAAIVAMDGSCDASEVANCPEDCGCGEASVAFSDFAALCGDGVCQSGGQLPETCVTCPRDCGPATHSDGDGIANCIDNCSGDNNPDQADADGDGIGDACDPDIDGDDVMNGVDACPDTVIPESVPTSGNLRKNRWTLQNADSSFTQALPQAGSKYSFTTTLTRGCSCEQIVSQLGLGRNHLQRGCSTSAMLQWIDNP